MIGQAESAELNEGIELRFQHRSLEYRRKRGFPLALP